MQLRSSRIIGIQPIQSSSKKINKQSGTKEIWQRTFFVLYSIFIGYILTGIYIFYFYIFFCKQTERKEYIKKLDWNEIFTNSY
jgi:Ni,Fe-hydrogenase I cytochrome b subunit